MCKLNKKKKISKIQTIVLFKIKKFIIKNST